MNSENRKYHSRSKPSKKRTSFQDRTVPEKRTDLQDRRASKKRTDLQDRKALKKQELTQKKTQPALPGSCPAAGKCGGCDLQGVPYEKQLERKDRQLNQLLAGLAEKRYPILGMKDPTHYRCKVNAAFGLDRKGKPILGRYEKNSHHIVRMESCMIEDEKANEIAAGIYSLLSSFRIRVYDEDSDSGFLRHVQIRRGFATDQYMVTLVCTDPVFPSKQNFVKALRSRFPEISTVILNINDRHTSMVLGERNIVLYGKGYIEDRLCRCTFRISPGSFYQVNPAQTQRLYETAIRYANLSGDETVLDAYCGTGTIGIIAAGHAKQVTGVELNQDAVRDAVWNARRNKTENIRFVNMDATDYMEKLSAGRIDGAHPDVLILDPPRSGTTPRFIEAAAHLGPEKIIYVSCSPDTLARDLKLFRKKGYHASKAQGVDLFPFTNHVETVCLLSNTQSKKKESYITLDVEMADYYRIKNEGKNSTT